VTTFSVWAPQRQQVELVLADARTPMHRVADGWWAVEVPGAGHGTDYAFALDAGPPRPDPRSPWQPHGIHAMSRLVDHAAFDWHDGNWRPPPVESGIIYELHVGTFTPTGTFESAIERLDHLGQLGVTHVELMPVQEFSGDRGWGYDGVDLYAPHHAYGGPDGLKRLVDACHARGLAVLLDVVYNHLGPAGNYLGEFAAEYFTDRYTTPWGQALNLDSRGSDEVRRFICDNALMWLRDYHVDGLRLDAVHALVDLSAMHLLEQLAVQVDRLAADLGRAIVLIAESDRNDPRLLRPRTLGGFGLDAQWNDDFHHSLHVALSGERHGYYADFNGLSDVATALCNGFVYGGRYSRYRGRTHGRSAGDLPGCAFVGFLQNHDQIGNRALGERSGRLLSPRRLMIGAALVLTAPFVPLLFQGEEWGASSPFQYFTGHQDPELGARVRDGRRQEFARFDWNPAEVPDPQDEATFARCKLDWQELTRTPHSEVLSWHRELIQLRCRLPALHDGRGTRPQARADDSAGWLIVERGPVVVACNLADRRQHLPLHVRYAPEVLLASEPGAAAGRGWVELPPESVAVLALT
jgi:maltooligosyltrehalose trehalohydrolase